MSKNLIDNNSYRKFAYFGEHIEKNVTYVASPIFPNKEVRSRFMCEASLNTLKECEKESIEAIEK